MPILNRNQSGTKFGFSHGYDDRVAVGVQSANAL